MKNIFTLLLACIFSSFLAVLAYDSFFQKEEIVMNEKPAANTVNLNDVLFPGRANNGFLSSAPTDFISASDIGRPAVVYIQAITKGEKSNRYRRDLSNRSSGSGVIIAPDGYIATNNHVVENAQEIEVTLNDNREFRAKVIGTDASSDLALLKIEEDNLPYLVIGNSDSLEIGEWVLAIGNPFRLQSTVTAGIVSAKARNINILENTGIESFIQTDAAVNPGNSGGALLNTAGELVGINTAIMTYSGRYEGFSFAIPSNLFRKIIYDIKEFGAVQRGWMGITINNVDNEKANNLNLDFVGGVYIERVDFNGAANEAGLKRGDVVTGVNEVETNSTPEFMEQVARYRPGDKIKIKYMRSGKSRIAEITLRNHLNTTEFVAIRKDKILLDLGFELRNLDENERRRLNAVGAYVVSVYRDTKIDKTNMDPGYIITSINGKSMASVDEVINELNTSTGSIFLEGFYENYPGEFPYTFDID